MHLYDPRTRQYSPWPPYWGEDAVDRIAVGYLDENGEPIHRIGEEPVQVSLHAADSVGDVKGPSADGDFAARQRDYRAEDPATRRVDTRYADPLGEAVDSADLAPARRLAADLSGRYGQYQVEFEAAPNFDGVGFDLHGVIRSGSAQIGIITRNFYRDGAGNLVVNNVLVDIENVDHRGKGISKALTSELEEYYVRSGVDRIELMSDEQGSNAWARRGFTWDTDPDRLQESLDGLKDAARELRGQVSAEAQAVLDDMVARLEVGHPRLPEPIDLAVLATTDEPTLGRQLLDDTSLYYVKYLYPPHDDVPLRLGTAAEADPLGRLGLPVHQPGTLSTAEAVNLFSTGELRMRELNEQLIRAGVTAEDRARALSELRNALRARAYDSMDNRVAAEFLSRSTVNPTFEELVARNEERGLTADSVYEAIIETSTHSRLAPGSLSDIETGAVYSQFELGMRALNEQMTRDGVSIEDRAETLSGLRGSLRAWTRELMENRPAAEWLSANESNPSFEDLVARYEGKGLSGDAVYQAIIDGATHSHYAAGTLSDEETRTVYTTFELRMRELRDQLLRDGVSAEERARTMYGMRATIRSWTRSLMENRELADWLNANEPNPTFDELVERNRAKGRVGDEIYEAIVASSTRSRGSVNAELGIDPENPPDLPPMRGPDDGRPPDQEQEEDTT